MAREKSPRTGVLFAEHWIKPMPIPANPRIAFLASSTPEAKAALRALVAVIRSIRRKIPT